VNTWAQRRKAIFGSAVNTPLSVSRRGNSLAKSNFEIDQG
jgi:hypothetical protein